jgi:hypothetical protein
LPARDLIRGSGAGSPGGFLAGPIVAVIYYPTAWTGTTLYGLPAALVMFAIWVDSSNCPWARSCSGSSGAAATWDSGARG